MTATRSLVRRGVYYDSLVLMQLQQALVAMSGVLEAGVAMGTDANREVLVRSGLLAPGLEEAGTGDLMIAVRATDLPSADEALACVDRLLHRGAGGSEHEYIPRSLETAARQLPEAGWVAISVPGRYAPGVARQALGLGKHVFLFSDHVPLAAEAELKRVGAERGLLVLGPECGTAMVGGVGLGFANRVKRGPVGLVSASGTGLQQVACSVGRRSGISHGLGTGGRDLADEVGAIATLQALDLLRRDLETKAIVLISKPPSAGVAGRVLDAARNAAKPVVVLFLGYSAPVRRAGDMVFASSLEDAARLAVSLVAEEAARAHATRRDPDSGAGLPFGQGQRFLRGLYSGGTLALEARLLLQGHGLVVSSFAPTSREPLRPATGGADETGHRILDLGAEEFTEGRPHPMIRHDLRVQLLRKEARDSGVAVILLDVVLGDGAHPDPARELAPACAAAIAEARAAGRRLEVIAVVVGTEEDPQGLDSQVQQLETAGAHVTYGNEEAIEHAARVIRSLTSGESSNPLPQVPLEALDRPNAVLNVGLEWFGSALATQGVQALHVDWRPPAGGDERLASILERMREG